MTRSSRWLTALSVMAALVLTAQAEWTLAQAVGWTIHVAWAWPLSLDAYVLAALRAGRDRGWALGLMSVSVCGSHALPVLWTTAVPWWVAGGLSVVPPLVAWRVHELMRGAHVDHDVAPPGPPVDHEPVQLVHPGPPVVHLTPGVGHYLDHVDQAVTHQVDHVAPDVDHPGPPRELEEDPVSPEDRVTWAMGQPGVATVPAIVARFGVSRSTAKRDRSAALGLTEEMD